MCCPTGTQWSHEPPQSCDFVKCSVKSWWLRIYWILVGDFFVKPRPLNGHSGSLGNSSKTIAPLARTLNCLITNACSSWCLRAFFVHCVSGKKSFKVFTGRTRIALICARAATHTCVTCIGYPYWYPLLRENFILSFREARVFTLGPSRCRFHTIWFIHVILFL